MTKNGFRVAVAALMVAGAMLPMAAKADGARRPMALMVMFDGLRADAIESGAMPNLTALRNGTWQAGYNGAWSVTGQTAPGVDTVSAPNHVTIATGVIPSKHGVTANGQTSSGNYSTYPTWLKRVVDEKSGTSALFVYSWSEDGSLGPADGVTFLGNSDAQNATDLTALLASANAPDATMYFIDAVDAAGHAGNYYTYTAGYTNALALTDGYLGACLSAIASRSTFADEDWLILVTSDHGGVGRVLVREGRPHPQCRYAQYCDVPRYENACVFNGADWYAAAADARRLGRHDNRGHGQMALSAFQRWQNA